MRYVGIELRKLCKSKVLLAASLITIPIFGLYPFMILSEPNMSMYHFFMRNWTDLSLMPLFIPTVIATTLLFAKEFQDRTMIYLWMKPIKSETLFFSKLIAVFLYASVVMILYALVLYGIGAVFLSPRPFDFDVTKMQSFIRCFLLFIYSFVGILLVSGLSCFFSFLIKNIFGASILSVIFWVSTTFFLLIEKSMGSLNLLVEGKEAERVKALIENIPLSTYKVPSMYYQLELKDYYRLFNNILVYNALIYLILIVMCLYWFKSLRRGKG